MEEKIEEHPVRLVGAYIFLQAVAGFMVVLACGIESWFTYCWWSFGLVSAGTNYKSQFNSELTVDDVYYDACGNAKVMVEDSCPHFCMYVQNFKAAGVVMVLFSTITLVAMSAVILLHVIWLSNPAFRFQSIFWVAILPPLFYSIGLLSYTLAAGLTDLHYTHNQPFFENPSDVVLEAGMILACVNAVINLVPFAYFYFKTLPILRNA